MPAPITNAAPSAAASMPSMPKTATFHVKTYVIPDLPKPRGASTSGKILWGPSGAAIWSAPTVDAKRGLIYAATGNTYSGDDQPNSEAVVAMEMKTGKIVWATQGNDNDVYLSGCRPGVKNPNCPDKNGPDFDFGTSPVLAGNVILIGSNPVTIGRMRTAKISALQSPAKADRLEVSNGASPSKAQRSSRSPTSPGPTPADCTPNIKTGEKVWVEPAKSAQSAAITVIPGAIFSGANDGILRAFSSKDGSVIWQYDTNKDFQNVKRIAPGQRSLDDRTPARR